jgi:hypothetical protein
VDRTGAMSFFICSISYSAWRDPSIGAASDETQTAYCTEMAIRCMNVPVGYAVRTNDSLFRAPTLIS